MSVYFVSGARKWIYIRSLLGRNWLQKTWTGLAGDSPAPRDCLSYQMPDGDILELIRQNLSLTVRVPNLSLNAL